MSSVTTSHGRVAAGGDWRASQPARLSLLGGFRLTRGGAERILPPGVQRLVAFVALQQRWVRRAYVAGQLWMDVSEQHAAASLRTTLWRAHVAAGELMTVTPTHVGLGEGVHVDVHEVMASADHVLRQADALADDDLASLVWNGELLPGWYDDWLVIERERVRQLRWLALEALCDRFRRAGRNAEATQAGLAAVATDPLRESAHRALIRAHLATGNSIDAIRQYRILASLLRRELGLTPSPETRALMRAANAR